MSKRVAYLTDEQWKKIEPLVPKRLVAEKVVGPGQTTVWYLKLYCGDSRPERDGTSFRTAIRTPQPDGVT